MPTARRAGQARSRCELQRWRRFLPGHNWHPDHWQVRGAILARYDRHVHEQQPRSPRCCIARAVPTTNPADVGQQPGQPPPTDS